MRMGAIWLLVAVFILPPELVNDKLEPTPGRMASPYGGGDSVVVAGVTAAQENSRQTENQRRWQEHIWMVSETRQAATSGDSSG